MKYISDGTWFDKDTECELLSDFGNGTGLFFGIRTCKKASAEGKPLGTKYRDEEVCGFDEFQVVDEIVNRKFFGKPLRNTSLEYNPYKLSMEEFAAQFQDGVDGFFKNLNDLPLGKKQLYMEEWVETFLAWFEVEQDPDA